jgi:large subunit ribosomal protein L15
VHGATKSAIAAVEKAGGSVKILAPAKDAAAQKAAAKPNRKAS